jgi:hypothetical protein
MSMAYNPLYRNGLEREVGCDYQEFDLLIYTLKHMLPNESTTAIFNILHIYHNDETIGTTEFIHINIYKNENNEIIIEDHPRAPSLCNELRIFLEDFKRAASTDKQISLMD